MSDSCRCAGARVSLNEGKRIIAATRGTLQGGELQGDLGWYKLAGDKQVNLVGRAGCLLGLGTWREFDLRHFVGKAVFGMCFRRPLLSIFQDSFHLLSDMMAAQQALPPKVEGGPECIFSALVRLCAFFREAVSTTPSELLSGPEPTPFLYQVRQRMFSFFLGVALQPDTVCNLQELGSQLPP